MTVIPPPRPRNTESNKFGPNVVHKLDKTTGQRGVSIIKEIELPIDNSCPIQSSKHKMLADYNMSRPQLTSTTSSYIINQERCSDVSSDRKYSDHTQHSKLGRSASPRMSSRTRMTAGTVLAAALFIYALASSPVVNGVPLLQNGMEFRSPPLPLEAGIPIHPASQHHLSDGDSSGFPQKNVNYLLQPQSHIYLPSLIKPQGSTQQDDDENQEKASREIGRPNQPMQRLRESPMEYGTGGGDASNGDWETVIDPHLYLLTEWDSDAITQQGPEMQQRTRRNSGPSLSIVNPLDVLRQRLLLEIARRKMLQSRNQIMANADLLQKIGRRRRR